LQIFQDAEKAAEKAVIAEDALARKRLIHIASKAEQQTVKNTKKTKTMKTMKAMKTGK
jgi:hypothetical protein